MGDLAKRQRARLTKFTPAVRAAVIENCEQGLPFTSACALAGVHRRTASSWLEEGHEDPTSEYAVFATQVAEAQARHKLRLLKKIEQVGFDKDQWAALMTILERVYGAEFKKESNQTTNVQVNVGLLEQRIHELKKKGELTYSGG